MIIKEYKRILQQIHRERDKLAADEGAILAALVQEHAPLKVGDIIEIPRQAYSHLGKTCKVTNVCATATRNWRNKDIVIELGIEGLVLKQDGTAGERKVHWWQNVEPQDDKN